MKTRSIAATAALTVIVLAGFAAGPFSSDYALKKRIVGDEQPLGEGTIRTWVLIGDNNEPTAIGITVSERAVETLPAAASLPAPFHMHSMQLSLPDEARVAGFDHVLFDWNAVGHEPKQLYSAPHFDVHFYLIDEGARLAIDPSDPEFEAKGMKAPEPDIIPADYISPEGNFTVPQMGTHWLDMHAPELNGQPFTQTMLYGFYGGRMIFIEPMVTIEYLRSKPNLELPMKQPARYERPGYYPTTYRYGYDEADRSYSISIEGLTRRP